MRRRHLLLCVASILLTPAWAQTSATDTARPSGSSTAARSAARPGAKGPLPDPTLLDGSNLQAEKKPDYGMLGEFEIPGDENSKSGKVGGQQNPNQKGGGGGQQQPQVQIMLPGVTPNLPGQQKGGLPSMGGGAGGQPPQGAGAQAGQQGGAAGGAAGGDQQANQNGQGTAGAAGGDPTGKAEGVQVAGLEGDPSAAGQGGAGGAAGDNVPKPQQVAIGDPTMQIKPAANAPGVVGQVAAGSTQNMESKIGKGAGGGGGGTPNTGGGGKGVEKGRTMPSGL